MPKGIRIQWKGDQYAAAVARETNVAIVTAALKVHKTVQKLLSQEGQTGTDSAGLNEGRTPGKRGANYYAGLDSISDLKSIDRPGIHWGGTAQDKDGKRLDRIYWNDAEGKWVQSSPPGKPPHKQTGELRRRINIEFESSNSHSSAKVGPQDSLIYARIQELGGKCGPGHRITLPPRPYLKPGLEANRETIEKLLRLAVLKAKVSI